MKVIILILTSFLVVGCNSGASDSISSASTINGTTEIRTEEITVVETDKQTYTPSESITVSYENISGDDEDWIGIYPKNANNDWGNVVDWTWANGIKEGYATFNSLRAGEYEARVFFKNSFNVEANVGFKVEDEDEDEDGDESGDTDQNNTIQYPQTTTLAARSTDTSVNAPTVETASYDPVFQTRIRKVNKSDSAIANYPKMQSWNKDMSLIRIASRLYDATTLEESSLTKNFDASQAFYGLCARGSDNFRWSNKDADQFYVLDNRNRLIEGKINNNSIDCSNVLESFSEYTEVHLGPHEGNIDKNDKYVAFLTKKSDDVQAYVVLYDIQNRTKVWSKLLEGFTWTYSGSSWEITDLDWVSVSPSGKYVLVNARDRGNYKEGMYIYDINFENRRKIQYEYNGNVYSEGGHGDMGFDMNGNEVLVQFLSGVGVYSFNLDNPTEMGKQVLRVYGGGHVSCRNFDRPGWCYMTTFETNYRQVFAVKLDGTSNETVQNFSQFHVNGGFVEVYGGPSPDGSQMIFNSNWGTANTSVIDTFIADIP